MDSKPIPVYQVLEVHTEWVHEAEDDTLIVYLPGFKKEQIKVHVTTGRNLRISGQRPLGDNKYGRFSQEFQIPSNCDHNKIRANFRGGMLHIKHPKLIVPAEKQEEEEEAKPSAQVPKTDQKPVEPPTPTPADASPKKHKNDQEQAVVEEAPPKATMQKETADKKDGVAKQADDVSSKTPDNVKEMKDAKNAADESDEKAEEEGKEGKGSDQKEKATRVMKNMRSLVILSRVQQKKKIQRLKYSMALINTTS